MSGASQSTWLLRAVGPLCSTLMPLLAVGMLPMPIDAQTSVAGSADPVSGPAALQVWPEDALVKVFRDAAAGSHAVARTDVARGEHASLQAVVRGAGPLTGLRADVSELRRQPAGVLVPRAPRFVGYVPVAGASHVPARGRLRQLPADFPDPLLEVETLDLPASTAQPIWITVPVPTNAAPGSYRGVLTVRARVDGRACEVRQALEIEVHPAVAGRSRLWVTDHLSMEWPHASSAVQPDSEAFYALLRRYARNLADHRHNVVMISPLMLATFSVSANGSLAIDFSRFDRWVQIFTEEGVIGRIEGGHIGQRKGDWDGPFVAKTRRVKNGQVVPATADPASAEAVAFHGQFLPALVSHLRERGWLGAYMQHLSDEPTERNVESYRQLSALVRTYAPELRCIVASDFGSRRTKLRRMASS